MQSKDEYAEGRASTIKRRTYLASMTTVLGVSVAGCSGGSDDEPAPVDDDSAGGDSDDSDGDGSGGGEDATPETRDVSATVGELVEGDNLHLVVEDFERGVGGGEFLEPDAGNEFAVAHVAIKNVSDDYVTVSNLLQTRLRDDEDYQYQQTFAGGDEPTFNDGQFAPGEVERGAIYYEIPEAAGGLTLVFDFDVSVFGGVERASIDLGSVAGSVHTLEQDLRVDVYDVGETIGFGDVEVRVDEVRTESELGTFAQPDEGNEYVIVDVSITNDTGEQKRFSTILQMMIKDENGYTYQEDLSATTELDRPFDEGTPLADGETRRGELVYEVPEGERPLYWVFEFELFATGDKTFWQLR